MKDWVKMPTQWIKNVPASPLPLLKWSGSEKANQTAALMLYIVFVQNANTEITTRLGDLGLVELTYEELSSITGLSKSKISGAIRLLEKFGLIGRILVGRRNIYRVENFHQSVGWAKLPARKLYTASLDRVLAFHLFKLRSKNELNALKLYLVIVAFRDNSKNFTRLGYEKITEYTGIARNDIRSAISFLVNAGLLHADTQSSESDPMLKYNVYRIPQIDPYSHRGTRGRAGV